jgi:hypothetical protein
MSVAHLLGWDEPDLEVEPGSRVEQARGGLHLKHRWWRRTLLLQGLPTQVEWHELVDLDPSDRQKVLRHLASLS